MDHDNRITGYQLSVHVAELFDAGDDEATFIAFIADIFIQRINSAHARAMTAPRFEGEALEKFIERAPRIISIIMMRDGGENFSIAKVQKATDDIVTLDGGDFITRYGLEELFRELSESEEAVPAAGSLPSRRHEGRRPGVASFTLLPRALAQFLFRDVPEAAADTYYRGFTMRREVSEVDPRWVRPVADLCFYLSYINGALSLPLIAMSVFALLRGHVIGMALITGHIGCVGLVGAAMALRKTSRTKAMER